MRRMLANIFWLGGKELFSLKRDAALVFLIIFSLTHFVYSPAKDVNMDVDRASIAVVDEDRSVLSQHIVEAFMPPCFSGPLRYQSRESTTRWTGANTPSLLIFHPTLSAI